MRYKESREQTAELLRMVLPLMARHAAGFHPLSYAVWYEYVAGYNVGLRAAVDERLKEAPSLSDADVAALFDRYVAMRDIESSGRMRSDIAELVDSVDQATTQAGDGVRQYGTELDGYQRRLNAGVDAQNLNQVVESLIGDTRRVRVHTEAFQQQLRESAVEVERLRAEVERAEGLALNDPLTALLNRRGMQQQAVRLCGEGLAGCSVLVVDIDNFKELNDAHGHLLGDKIIVAVANVLRAAVGERGPVARIGGEEFAVLLGQTSVAGAAELAERIRGAVERGKIRRADTDESIGNVTVSIGVTGAVPDEGFDAMLTRASQVMSESKHAGRNRVSVAQREPPAS